MGYTEIISNALRFKGAGNFRLTRLTTDGTPSKELKDIYTAGQNVAGVINTAWSRSTTPLESENFDDPVALYNTGTDETIGIEQRSEDPYLDIFLKGGTISEPGKGSQTVIDYMVTIAADDPGTPTAGVYQFKTESGSAAEIDENGTVLVRDVTTNGDYSETSNASPAAGEYSYDPTTATFTFAKDDIGKRVYINADFIVDDVVKFVRAKNAASTAYELIISGNVEQYDETGKRWVSERYPSVQVASGELATLARQKAPASKTLNFQRIASKENIGSSRTFSSVPIQTVEG